MIILDKVSKKCIIRSVNRALCAHKIVILFAIHFLLKIFKRFTVHEPPVHLFKLDLIYIFDSVKNFVASPARIVLAAI